MVVGAGRRLRLRRVFRLGGRLGGARGSEEHERGREGAEDSPGGAMDLDHVDSSLAGGQDGRERI